MKEKCRDCGKEENIGFGYCRECAVKKGAKLKMTDKEQIVEMIKKQECEECLVIFGEPDRYDILADTFLAWHREKVEECEKKYQGYVKKAVEDTLENLPSEEKITTEIAKFDYNNGQIYTENHKLLAKAIHQLIKGEK